MLNGFWGRLLIFGLPLWATNSQASNIDLNVIQPYWTESVSLAQMIVFPLALEFVNRETLPLESRVYLHLDLEGEMHFQTSVMDSYIRADEARARQRFATAVAKLAIGLNSEFVRPHLDDEHLSRLPRIEKEPASINRYRFNFAPPAHANTAQIQGWLKQTEAKLIEAFPHLGQASSLVVADFLNFVKEGGGRSKNSLYHRLSEDPEMIGLESSTEWTRTERQLKLFGLSLFTPEARYASSLKELFDRPPKCSDVLR